MLKLVPTEEEEQTVVVQFLELKGIKHTAIPHSTWTPSFNQMRKNKRTGVKPGIPDLLIIHNQKILFIEMKRIKGGVISKEQKEWIEVINTVPNCQALICKGSNDAIEMIKQLIL